MEFVDAALKVFELLRDSWTAISNCFINYRQILDEKFQTMTTKMEKLISREEDINTQVRHETHLGGKKQKTEVEIWLKEVQHKKSEVQEFRGWALICHQAILEHSFVDDVYVEAYTCPCVRRHPFDPYFVAQSNGNYIAIFSSSPPFKLDKYKRYESHGVSGFPIKCNFSVDGEKVASGSSDGCIYIYDCKSSELVRKIKAYEQACIDVAFHPNLPNVIASCCWNGDVSIYE